MNTQEAVNVKPNQKIWTVDGYRIMTQKVLRRATKEENYQGIQFYIDVDGDGFRQLVTKKNLEILFYTKKEAIKTLKEDIKQDIRNSKLQLKEKIRDSKAEIAEIKREIKKASTKLQRI